MDIEQQRKRQAIKVIFSEAVMFLAVIIVMVILVMVVSGYWINQDFKIERQGMIQINSLPTGADIVVDGESGWMQRTNGSKIVASGEHDVEIRKEGYSSWKKHVYVSDGLMYRLGYVRLFPVELISEEAGLIDNTFTKNIVSRDHKKVIYTNNTDKWAIQHIGGNTAAFEDLDVSGIIPGTSRASGASTGIFSGNILSARWNRDNNKVLFDIQDSSKNWVILDVDNPEHSLNLTRAFGMNFSDNFVSMDDSGDNILAVENGNLRKINVPGKSISGILATNVGAYDYFDGKVVFYSDNGENRYIGGLDNFESLPKKILDAENRVLKINLGRFYDNDYLTIVDEKNVSLYSGRMPGSDEDKDAIEEVLQEEIGFVPTEVQIGKFDDFVLMKNGDNVATLDMESENVNRFTIESPKIYWLDDYLFYVVKDGTMIAYDYDGLNRHELINGVSSAFEAFIHDTRWLYYYSDGKLMRTDLFAS